MNSLLIGYLSFDSVRQLSGTFFPTIESNSPIKDSLNISENQALSKIKTLSDNIFLSKDNIIRLCKGSSISFEGTSSRTVLCIGVKVVRAIANGQKASSTPFLQSYDEEVNRYPASYAGIQKITQIKSDTELHTYLGLHNRCKWMLCEDEIRFILAHEIKGHAAHNDNAVKLAYLYVATLTVFVTLNIFFPDQPVIPLIALSYLMGKVVGLPFSRHIESRADRVAVIDDKAAKRGAKRYFKKHLIAEVVSKELDRRNSAKKSVVQRIVDTIEDMSQLTHPSTASRLKTVL